MFHQKFDATNHFLRLFYKFLFTKNKNTTF